MQKSRFFLVAILLITSLAGATQDNEIILRYINTYNEIAVAEMQRTGVPASIKLAQGIHETMAGTSELVKKSNNHFGIKCKTEWNGESVTHDDDRRGECFRKYENSMDSYRDHSNFLKGSSRYASLFKLDALDYKDWAYGLKKAGYATNPKYPLIIIKLIEDYHLQDYTFIALGKLSREEMLAKNPGVPNPPKNELVADAMKQAEEAMASQNVEITVEDQVEYPSGEFRINDTRVIYAAKGTPVLTIAQQYNVSLARLFEFNEMQETEILEKNQLLYLQRKRKTGTSQFHIVKAGETLMDIARSEAIRLESLLEYNHLNASTRPAVGEQLYLHKKAPAMPKLETRIVAANRGIVE